MSWTVDDVIGAVFNAFTDEIMLNVNMFGVIVMARVLR